MHNSIRLSTGFVTKETLKKLHLEDLDETDDKDDKRLPKDEKQATNKPKLLIKEP